MLHRILLPLEDILVSSIFRCQRLPNALSIIMEPDRRLDAQGVVNHGAKEPKGTQRKETQNDVAISIFPYIFFDSHELLLILRHLGCSKKI